MSHLTDDQLAELAELAVDIDERLAAEDAAAATQAPVAEPTPA